MLGRGMRLRNHQLIQLIQSIRFADGMIIQWYSNAGWCWMLSSCSLETCPLWSKRFSWNDWKILKVMTWKIWTVAVRPWNLHQEMAACAYRAHVNTGSWLLPKLDELCLGTWMNVVDMIWYVDIIYIYTLYMICMIWCWNVAKDHLAQRKNMETCILWQQLMSSTSARS